MNRHQARRWGALAPLAVALPLLALGQTAAHAQTASPAEPKISLTLRDTPLRTALELLFQQSGLQHAVEAAVPNTPVTLNLRDATFATALRVVTRLASVTYRKEGDVYVIGLRQPPAFEPSTTETAPPEQATATPEQTWEKIPIQFNHVAIYGLAFGGTLLPTEDQVQSGGLGGYGGGRGGYGGNLGGYGNGLGGGLGNSSGLGGLNGGLGGFNSGLGGVGGLNNGLGGLNNGLSGLNNGLGGSYPSFRSGGRF